MKPVATLIIEIGLVDAFNRDLTEKDLVLLSSVTGRSLEDHAATMIRGALPHFANKGLTVSGKVEYTELMYVLAQQRPDNFDKLPTSKQWEIDKGLGILDWDGGQTQTATVTTYIALRPKV